MATFSDAAGREWELLINLPIIQLVRKSNEIDLLALLDPSSGVASKLSDSVTLSEVVWTMINKQATERGVDWESFAMQLTGDVFEDALNALVVAFANFSPKEKRPIILDLHQRTQAISNRKLSQFKVSDDELERIMDDQFAQHAKPTI